MPRTKVKKKVIGGEKPKWTPQRRAAYKTYLQDRLSTLDTPAKRDAWLRTQYGQITEFKGGRVKGRVKVD